MTLHFTTQQKTFRGRFDNGTQATATFIAANDTNWTQQADQTFRIRFVLQETGGATGTFVPQLQYQRNGGGYNNVTGTSSVVRAVDSAGITDGVATTSQLGTGTGTFAAGSVDDVDGLTANVSVAASGFTEVEYVVQIRSADTAGGDTINLRVVGKSTAGTVLDTYTATPAITVFTGVLTDSGTASDDLDNGLPRWRSSSTLTGATGADGQVPVPAGVQANDVVVVGWFLEPSVTLTGPDGTWQERGGVATAGTRLRITWHRASGPESGTYNFTHLSTFREAYALRISGLSTAADPWDNSTAASDEVAGTTTPGVAITTSLANTMLVWFATTIQGSDGFTAPSVLTLRHGTSAGASATGALDAAGTTGTLSGTLTSGAERTAFLGALKPAGGAEAKTLADSGAATDTLQVTAQMPLPDTGASVDSLTVDAGLTPITLTDSGTGTDQLPVAAQVPLADSGAGADTTGVQAPRAFTTANSGTAGLTSLQFTTPSVAVAGDVLVAVCSYELNDATDRTNTIPSGWAAAVAAAPGGVADFSTSGLHTNVAWKVAAGGQETHTWTFEGGANLIGATIVCLVYPGLNPTGPFEAAAYSVEGAAAVTLHTGAAFAATTAGTWGLGVFSARTDESWTLGGGLVERVDYGTGVAPGITIAVGDSNGQISGTQTYTGTSSAGTSVATMLTAALVPVGAVAATPKTLTDAGVGADSLRVDVEASPADSGQAADSLAVAAQVPLAEQGTASDTARAQAAIGLPEGGTGTDSLDVATGGTAATVEVGAIRWLAVETTPKTLSDAGVGADSLQATAAVSLVDSGVGAETLRPAAQLTVADSGMGADSLTVGQFEPKPLGDAGTGNDSLRATATTFLAETGSAADALPISAAALLIDSATAADSLTVNQGIPKTLADSGTAGDQASVAAQVPLPESGQATDTLGVAQTRTLTDSGAGVDSLQVGQFVPKPLNDSGSAADQLFAAAQAPLADQGTGVDTLAGVAQVPLADSGQAADTLVAATAGETKQLTDSGQAADSLAVAQARLLTDSAAGTDSLDVNQGRTLTDSGAAVDSLRPAALVVLADGATATDLLALVALSALTDSGSGSDAMVVLTVARWIRTQSREQPTTTSSREPAMATTSKEQGGP